MTSVPGVLRRTDWAQVPGDLVTIDMLVILSDVREYLLVRTAASEGSCGRAGAPVSMVDIVMIGR